MLNDECINGAALLLQSHFISEFGSSDVAILTIHDLVRIRYGASDEDLWRNSKRSEYWTKGVWVLPIHRKDAQHWVLCVIYPARKQLHLLDSFADRRGWFPDLKVRLISTSNDGDTHSSKGRHEINSQIIYYCSQSWTCHTSR